MAVVNNSLSKPFSSWVDDKAMKLAQSFVARLKNQDDSFVNISIKFVAAETIVHDDEGTSSIRKNGIMIRAQLRKPCAHAKAELHFRDLIEDMELAEYSSRFSPDEIYRLDEDTTDYILSFAKKDTIES
ncbi:MAG: hypothetical protein ISN29_10720 [Gammaproteobacteria bacterium AqS3]|nr:hypothetical protein [Gammaproteobacteria bacterium AqS3]